MSISFNEIAMLVARFGNSVVQEEANMAAPTVGKGTIKKEKQSGTVGIVNVKAGGLHSTEFITDSGDLPTGSNVDIKQMAYHPKALFTRLSIPRISALTAISKQDGVNLVREQMQSAGADLGRVLGRALFSSPLGGIDVAAPAATALGLVEIPILDGDVSGYRVGSRVDGFGAVGQAFEFSVDVTGINVDLAGTPTLGMITGVVRFMAGNATGGDAGAIVTTLPILLTADSNPSLQGSVVVNTGVPSDKGMCSLLDAASDVLDPFAAGTGLLGSNGNYSGINNVTPEYTGNTIVNLSPAGPLALEKLDELSQTIKRKSGKPWTHTILNSTMFHAYMALLVSNRQFIGGSQKSDASVSDGTYEGKPIQIDENMADGKILLFNDKDVKLAEWRNFEPDSDGKDAAMVSREKFEYDTQIFGMYNLRILRRHCLGTLTGITSGW
jgi:hypothetical protein